MHVTRNKELSDFSVTPESLYPPDFLEWIALTPGERIARSGEMWDIYIAYGGTFEPDIDTQSPFFDPEAETQSPAYGGAGVRLIRRC
jgi:hypothetical protein